MPRPAAAVRAAAVVLLLCAGQPAAARVVLVGLDGGSWNVIDPLLRAGQLPNLERLAGRGVAADLDTVEPVISPAVWTSIATGRRPEAHGVMDFLATRLGVETPTAFERLAASGLRVGLYEYLVTWPPVRFPGGFVIPGWLRRDAATTPEDVWTRAGVAPFLTEQEPDADAYLAWALREGERKPAVWNALAEAFALDVGAVTFYGVDRISHRFWQAAHPEAFNGPAPAAPPAHRRAIRDTVRAADRALGAIAGALGPDDVILVVSDHGFQARDELRSVWISRFHERLTRAGLGPGRDAFSVVTEFGYLVLRVHPGPFEAREALLTRLADMIEGTRGPEGGSLYDLYVLDQVERPAEHRRSWIERVRQWGVRRVLDFVFDVRFERPAHAVLVARPDDARLAALWPDGDAVVEGERVPVRDLFQRDLFSGAHHPTGIFVAAGGPIAPRAGRERLSVLDVAPLLFYLAGAAIPDDLEGALPRAWLDAAHLDAHPPRTIPAAEVPRLADEGGLGDGAADQALRERLRSLGYLE